MSVRKEGKSWYFSVKYKDDFGNVKYAKRRGFSTKRDALNEEARFLQELNRKAKYFFELSDEYLSYLNSSKDHAQRIYNALKHHFPFYRSDMSVITRQKLLAWRNKLQDEDISIDAKNRYMSYVRAVLKYASEYSEFDDLSIYLKSFKKPRKKEFETWTIEEFRRFEDCIDDYVFKTFFHILFWTGMRRGEAIALTWDDYDGESLRVNKSVKDAIDGAKETKTKNSDRRILLDKKTIEMINALPRKNYLFGDKYLSPSSIARAFDKGIKESGVKPIRLHDLRHSHATVLINSGANIVAVSKRLGHSSVSITLDCYTHLLDKTAQELVDEINKII